MASLQHSKMQKNVKDTHTRVTRREEGEEILPFF